MLYVWGLPGLSNNVRPFLGDGIDYFLHKLCLHRSHRRAEGLVSSFDQKLVGGSGDHRQPK